MALTATTIFEVEADTGSSDTLNSGGYDTATTGKPTDLTTTANTGNTASPVLKSATYNFNAGAGIDAGSWVHIATSGGASGWVAGWYKVLSVASNQATVDASIGAVVLANYTLNTAVGCATTATPTSGTFSMDYSQVPAVVFSLTGLTTAAANAIILTASATKAMVGNLIQITGGTNFTTGFYVIQACTAGVSLTVDRNCTTAAGLAGTAGIGGALASPGQAGAVALSGNDCFIKTGTYTVTSASSNVAGGCLTTPTSSSTANIANWQGYSSNRADLLGRPVIKADGVITTFTLVTVSGGCQLFNIEADGNSRTSSRGFSLSGNGFCYLCLGRNCTNSAFNGASNSQTPCVKCEATTCSTQPAFNQVPGFLCSAYSNTITGYQVTTQNLNFCMAINNSGASSDGIATTGACQITNCTTYTNGRDGYRHSVGAQPVVFINCLGTGNAGWQFNASAAIQDYTCINCAAKADGSGTINTTNITCPIFGFVTLTSDPFIAAGTNFALTPAAIALLAGIPGSFPGLASTTGYLYIGAVQPNNQGIFVATHTAMIVNPLTVVGY